jgi:hypothetical protein
MTLGNMRAKGVRSLAVARAQCHRELSADRFSGPFSRDASLDRLAQQEHRRNRTCLPAGVASALG